MLVNVCCTQFIAILANEMLILYYERDEDENKRHSYFTCPIEMNGMYNKKNFC